MMTPNTAPPHSPAPAEAAASTAPTPVAASTAAASSPAPDVQPAAAPARRQKPARGAQAGGAERSARQPKGALAGKAGGAGLPPGTVQAGAEQGKTRSAAKDGKQGAPEKAPHTEVPNQSGDYISPWNGARLKCIQNPHPELKTEQIHVLRLPELCPASHNPMPGSSITVSYRGKGRFLEVFSLSAYIQASIGHPIVRDVEALTQAIAIDCAQALGQKVEVDGLFELRGLAQTVMTEVVAKPRKPTSAAEGSKASRAGKGGKSAKVTKDGKDGRKGDKKSRR
ncbi:MAG: hypothetical protein Q4D91_08870 [Lautropia sp.]|nr:hypothetical protein [Lautropia sp.]